VKWVIYLKGIVKSVSHVRIKQVEKLAEKKDN